MSFNTFDLHPDLLPRRRRPRLRRADPDPAGRHPAGPRGPRRARLRHDRQRQDRRVPAADPPAPARTPARDHARPRPRAHARAGGADRRAPPGARAPHAPHGRRRLRRRRHGPAGAGAPPRRRRPRRHARAACSTTSSSPTPGSPGSRCWSSTRPTACSTWGSCRTSAASSSSCRRGARRCSSRRRCRRPIVALAREMLRDPVTIDVERPAAPATGITHTAYPVATELKSRLLLDLLERARHAAACSPSRGPSTARTGWRSSSAATGSAWSASTATAARPSGRRRWPASRAASTRCWWPPTSRRAASTSTR